MFYIRTFLTAVACVIAVSACGGSGEAPCDATPSSYSLYLSPAGSDTNPGTITDPLLTLEGAKAAIRGLDRSGISGPINVCLRTGTYPMSAALVLEKEDSGTEQSPITYKSYPGETAVISGGMPLTKDGWETSDGLWRKALPVRDGLYRDLYRNGARVKRARTDFGNPIVDSYTGPEYMRQAAAAPQIFDGTIPASSYTHSHNDYPSPLNRRKNVFEVSADFDSRLDKTMVENSELVMFHSWTNSRMHIESFNYRNSGLPVCGTPPAPCNATWIQFRGETTPYPDAGNQARFYLENYEGGLSEEGTWYLDPSTFVLSYRPRSNETADNSEFVLPVTENLILFNGSETGPVEYVNFEDLTFGHTASFLPQEGVSLLTDGTPLTGTIEGKYFSNCKFLNNEFTHLGADGIKINEGGSSNTVSGNRFEDIGASAIKIGRYEQVYLDTTSSEEVREKYLWKVPSRNVVSENIIPEGPKVYFDAVGIALGMAIATDVSGNTINGGWQWGIANGHQQWLSFPSLNYDNIIEGNRVENISAERFVPHAAIYNLGGASFDGYLSYTFTNGFSRDHGNIYRNNTIIGVDDLGCGLVFDAGTWNALVQDNLIHHVDCGISGNYTSGNSIYYGNKVYFARSTALMRYGDNPYSYLEEVQTSWEGNQNFFIGNTFHVSDRDGDLLDARWWPTWPVEGTIFAGNTFIIPTGSSTTDLFEINIDTRDHSADTVEQFRDHVSDPIGPGHAQLRTLDDWNNYFLKFKGAVNAAGAGFDPFFMYEPDRLQIISNSEVQNILPD